jgi:uncharacterized protein
VKTKLLILPILFLLFSVQVFAEDLILERIIDNAGLLSTSQKNELTILMNSIVEKYNFDLVIVTETSLGSIDPGDYADVFFDYNGYGRGDDKDGCLYLQVIETRDIWFSTSGRGINILNPYAFQKLETDTIKYLSEGNSYAAFRAFILAWDQFLNLEAKGRNYIFVHQWNIVLVIIAWLVAFGIGFLIVHVWKKGMNTAIPQTQAAAYIVPGSLNFTAKKDSFLYSKVTKIKRQTQSSSGGSGGTHISSSGRKHGGGGRKY